MFREHSSAIKYTETGYHIEYFQLAILSLSQVERINENKLEKMILDRKIEMIAFEQRTNTATWQRATVETRFD
jgi:hypothetical protein